MIATGYDLVAPTVDELRGRYADYRLRQARSLVSLLPQEAVRPLYRRALAVVAPSDLGAGDPLAVLVEYCATILPLPPFEVWVDDALSNPAAHLAELDDSGLSPTAAAPAMLEARRVDTGAESWIARLMGFRDQQTWRGFISFECDTSGRSHRTSLIFRETDPSDLRARFLEFESATLCAFLRSSLHQDFL